MLRAKARRRMEFIEIITNQITFVDLKPDDEKDKNVMDPEEFDTLPDNPQKISKTDLIPFHTNQNFLRLGGWKLNISKTIFEDTKVDEVLEGWKMLSDLLPFDLFSSVLFLRTAYEYLKLGLTYEKGFETDLLELLRLCLWYYRCSKVENIDLRYKKSELRKQLGGELSVRVKKYLSPDPNQSTYELSEVLPVIISTKLSKDIYDITNDFQEKVSSYVSEFTIAALAAVYNFAVRFNQKVEGESNFDMLIQGIPCEVETMLDQVYWAEKQEPELRKEILVSLKREKMKEKIEDALRQGAKIIFVNSTVTSLSWGINIDASRNMQAYPLERAVILAVDHATHSPNSSVPVMVFGTSIDYERNYRLSAFFVSYPSDDGTNIDPLRLLFDHVHF
ncbi:MAG: hypothetical protein WAM14_14525 [Candidatus Nitrosopolaris sp.]